MTIEKNGVIYTITENEKGWTIKSNIGKLAMCYNASKTDFATLEELKDFIMNDKNF